MCHPIELTHHIPVIASNIYNLLIVFMKNKSSNKILILYLNGWSSNLLVTSLICVFFFFPFWFLKICIFYLLTSRYLTFKIKSCVFFFFTKKVVCSFKTMNMPKYCFHYFQKKKKFSNLTFHLIFVIIIHFKIN
jgi:hypothetical protein